MQRRYFKNLPAAIIPEIFSSWCFSGSAESERQGLFAEIDRRIGDRPTNASQVRVGIVVNVTRVIVAVDADFETNLIAENIDVKL